MLLYIFVTLYRSFSAINEWSSDPYVMLEGVEIRIVVDYIHVRRVMIVARTQVAFDFLKVLFVFLL